MTQTLSDSVSVKTFLSILKNPLLRSVIRFSGKNCAKFARSYLEVALDDYAGNQDPQHSLVRSLFSGVFGLTLDVGCEAFGVNRRQARDAMMTSYFKKGLVNVLKGIGRYGITRPQRLAAPFLVVWNYTNNCNLKCRHCYQSAEKPDRKSVV